MPAKRLAACCQGCLAWSALTVNSSMWAEWQKCKPRFGAARDQARGKVVCDSAGTALDLACQHLSDLVYLCRELRQSAENTPRAIVQETINLSRQKKTATKFFCFPSCLSVPLPKTEICKSLQWWPLRKQSWTFFQTLCSLRAKLIVFTHLMSPVLLKDLGCGTDTEAEISARPILFLFYTCLFVLSSAWELPGLVIDDKTGLCRD